MLPFLSFVRESGMNTNWFCCGFESPQPKRSKMLLAIAMPRLVGVVGEVARSIEDLVNHGFGEFPGKGVLLARVKGANNGDGSSVACFGVWFDVNFDTMTEFWFVGRSELLKGKIIGKLTKCYNNA